MRKLGGCKPVKAKVVAHRFRLMPDVARGVKEVFGSK